MYSEQVHNATVVALDADGNPTGRKRTLPGAVQLPTNKNATLIAGEKVLPLSKVPRSDR